MQFWFQSRFLYGTAAAFSMGLRAAPRPRFRAALCAAAGDPCSFRFTRALFVTSKPSQRRKTMTTKKPLFKLGQIVATPGALEAVPSPIEQMALLSRHVNGDWGSIDPDDAAANDAAIAEGDRLLSAYPIDPNKPCRGYGENCIWIITEADRSVTTFLLPEEY
jgi:hypothetical protein